MTSGTFFLKSYPFSGGAETTCSMPKFCRNSKTFLLSEHETEYFDSAELCILFSY